MSVVPKYQTILLKLSGEALAGDDGHGINMDILTQIAKDVKEVHELNVKIGIVIGGGNLFRGQQLSSRGMDRATADYMGMLGTVMNCMALQEFLERKMDVPTRVLTAIAMKEIAEPYIRRRALRHLEKNRVVIFGAGTGNPFFSTDTAASLRALEIRADVVLKATKVDGVYDKDPMLHSDAVMYKEVSYIDALSKRLKVMDSTALSLCMDNNLPICVFSLSAQGSIKKVVLGENIGTMVGGK